MLSYLWLWSQKPHHCFQLPKDTLVPCDCLIINGSAIVNEATLTGGNLYRINFATGERWRGASGWGVCPNRIQQVVLIQKGNVGSQMTLFQVTVLEIGSIFYDSLRETCYGIISTSSNTTSKRPNVACTVPFHHILDRWLVVACQLSYLEDPPR